jgi:rubrerythrin
MDTYGEEKRGGRTMDPLQFNSPSSKAHAKDFKDPNKFISELRGAINDEASAIKFYEILEGMAPNQYRDFVTHAKNDEMAHLHMFRKLYRRLTGYEPYVQAEVTEFSTYKEGIEIAFRRELEAAELYRNMYLSTRVPKIRDVLFKTMTDEMEHAQRFSFLYFLS